MEMMMKYIFSILCIMTISIVADGPNSYGKEPILYLFSKPVIIFVVKSSGGLSLSEYYKSYRESSTLTDQEIKNNWLLHMRNTREMYSVIKVIKGKGISIGEELDLTNMHTYGRTIIGNRYIYFLSKSGNEYSFESCDFASMEDMSINELSEILTLKQGELINKLVHEYLMECLYKVLTKGSNVRNNMGQPSLYN